MNNYDYVILFDENGQPYIAHSFWSNAKSWGKKTYGRASSVGKKAHKYLLKVGEGAKARYAYTKQEVDALMGRGRQAVKKAASTFAYRNVPGYAERVHWQNDEKKAAEAKAYHDKLNSEYAKAVNTTVDIGVHKKRNRDTSASASKAYDDAVSICRNLVGNETLLKAQQAEWSANEATWDSGRAYAKTPLGKVENFLKDPVWNTKMAVSGVVWDIQDKVEEVKQKSNERKQARKDAKREKQMQKDPKVMKARDDVSKRQSEFDDIQNRFMEYVQSPQVEAGSEKWNRLNREYKRAVEELEYAQYTLDRYESKYK